MAELELTQVKKSFGAVDVIKGVDLDIKSGEFIVFVGPSGCGKSTLLRLHRRARGHHRRHARRSTARWSTTCRRRKRGIAMVFQSYALYPHMTVYDNMAFGLKLGGGGKDEIDKRVARGRRDPAAHALSRPPAQAALRRPAPARRHRPRHRPRPAGLPLRRAAVEPRRGAARRDAHRDRQAARAHARHDHDLRHPRPGRGDDARRPHRRAQRRRRRAGRRADGALPPARPTCSSPASSARRR